MVVMRVAASVDDNSAPRLSCPSIRTVEILREKAGICKLEASYAANDARRHGLKRDTSHASSVASRHGEFPRLGLTDAALLEVVSADAPLLTVDLDLSCGGVGRWE